MRTFHKAVLVGAILGSVGSFGGRHRPGTR